VAPDCRCSSAASAPPVQRYVGAVLRVLVGGDLARKAAAQQASGRGAPDNTLVLDAADPLQRAGVEQALQHYERLDVLVNIIRNTGSAHALTPALLRTGTVLPAVSARGSTSRPASLLPATPIAEPHAVDPAVADAVLAAFTRHLAQQLGVRGCASISDPMNPPR
jgi:hypothetical protein